MKPRKLLRPDILTDLAMLTELGVPVAAAMRQKDIDLLITRPVVADLLESYARINEGPLKLGQTIQESVFPEWLDSAGCRVQEQPDNYNYIGFFPEGYWECKTLGHS
jgi:hypothetical protein